MIIIIIKKRLSSLVAVLWSIWLEMNNQVFNETYYIHIFVAVNAQTKPISWALVPREFCGDPLSGILEKLLMKPIYMQPSLIK